ncbi:NAD(P)/FAD-dependent oxidoreductase [Actinokineospora sp.]|uniref:NAD(P)/FAD-dependent oxidoreductase n=1 Tax=Actinokineospora sp. TaxID=1872133 RepID=UPI004037E8FB
MTAGYDVIVVGARCAGSTTALLFARAGHRVLLVDRVTFPRDTLSTLYIQQPGVAQLARWGVLAEVTATGCPPVYEIAYQVGDVRVIGRPSPVDGVTAAYAPRRIRLDSVLIDAAVAAGVEFREGCAVAEVLSDGDRVTGVRLTGRGTEHARLVVGADGMRSTVAAKVGARTLVEHPRRTCVYYTYWPALSDRFEVYEGHGGSVGVMPTSDGATGVAAYFPQSRFGQVRTDAMNTYLAGVRALAPELSARMAAAGPLDRLYGTGDQRNFFREAAGPGWALVGDAAHHLDSITARGITNAFCSATLLVDGVAGHLDDEPRLRAALADYARRNYRSMIEDYKYTLRVSRLKPPGHQARMLRDIGADPVLTEQFFSVVSGSGGGPELRARMLTWLSPRTRPARV